MTITCQRIQYCLIMKDITATPFVTCSSLLHQRPGAVKPLDLVKKFHHVSDKDKTPAILVSLDFFHFSFFFLFMCCSFFGNHGKRFENLHIYQS
ncbi:hypothetical protein MTR67_047894 [Solanum verrucosum]|uniref:Uncharacterized protein n=1 Tax=Solanum verrucosum TaxID=315347 RepID=A0AAF0UZV2_SOLVR|nr:hypothetical protein MTR67_047894 [Solanum verrucosum]